ncbi:adenylate/guanylate cyclase domain-containing protein [Mycobacterium sp. ITM-2016-00318]|uniref:adenylate/guanylate cyclase domain-containing protein n=1 Tax=Mycobacterium sp. ITM-2016-00318 TaxID=2099693 RepID=UPI000CF9F848|nr:adenylate/guanylate cyclase domain-containing protein [Mycobacterium sp. ITM-2016-00318]WNG91068.1 adenylate/guanylate cyclase domain-containing protein [Mycobacterium sp. ITM-2016-00318]
MADFDALETAGIANARERAALIEYLDGLGFTAEEMVAAERRGRLFGLAGDAVRSSGRPVYSLRTAAEVLGQSVEQVEHSWALLGLTIASPDHIVLSQRDVDALETCALMSERMGADRVEGLLRFMGAAMSRLAEAETTVLRSSAPDFWITRSHDELTTARTWRALAELIPRAGSLLDVIHRHHLTRPNLFENVTDDPSSNVTCGVGFADLSGFTALTHVLTPVELSALLNGFSATATDVIRREKGRVVKFIGDAVMWVSSTPQQLVDTAGGIIGDQRTLDAGLRVRAGLSFGQVLAINGDYFGEAVNLAARLVAAALPGQILVASEVREALPDRAADPQDPLTLKGFDEPVSAFDMSACGGA